MQYRIALFGIAIFIDIIGILAIRDKDPMHFMNGRIVEPEEVRDIPRFNRANAIMWWVFSVIFWVAGALIPAHMEEGIWVIVIGCCVSMFSLPLTYKFLLKKYHS